METGESITNHVTDKESPSFGCKQMSRAACLAIHIKVQKHQFFGEK
jgi:hypothetical protein